MKEVLMSIRPEWCAKIFDGTKTIEVRKSRPLIDMPFKVYVYCVKAKDIREDGLYLLPNDSKLHLGIRKECLWFVCNYGDFRNGKVIGSFVCDRIFEIPCETTQPYWLKESTRLADEQYMKYLGCKNGYGWHITEPKLFDKPRDITEFAVFGKCADECSEYDFCARDIAEDRATCKCFKRTFLKRPPQSWCYVEGGDRE